MPKGVYHRTDYHRFIMSKYNSRYWKGKHKSVETKEKISKKNKGKLKGKHNSIETEFRKGHIITDIMRRKLSIALKGLKRSDESKKRLSLSKLGKNNPMYGKHPSKETRMKMRISKLKYMSEKYNNGEVIYPVIGKEETSILNYLEKDCFNYPILRQYLIDGYWLDGYCPALNLAIEIDEKHHNNPKQKKRDMDKEKYVRNKLNCKFIRILVK
jgi:very-short-patch-repair endonuclease